MSQQKRHRAFTTRKTIQRSGPHGRARYLTAWLLYQIPNNRKRVEMGQQNHPQSDSDEESESESPMSITKIKATCRTTHVSEHTARRDFNYICGITDDEHQLSLDDRDDLPTAEQLEAQQFPSWTHAAYCGLDLNCTYAGDFDAEIFKEDFDRWWRFHVSEKNSNKKNNCSRYMDGVLQAAEEFSKTRPELKEALKIFIKSINKVRTSFRYEVAGRKGRRKNKVVANASPSVSTTTTTTFTTAATATATATARVTPAQVKLIENIQTAVQDRVGRLYKLQSNQFMEQLGKIVNGTTTQSGSGSPPIQKRTRLKSPPVAGSQSVQPNLSNMGHVHFRVTTQRQPQHLPKQVPQPAPRPRPRPVPPRPVPQRAGGFARPHRLCQRILSSESMPDEDECKTFEEPVNYMTPARSLDNSINVAQTTSQFADLGLGQRRAPQRTLSSTSSLSIGDFESPAYIFAQFDSATDVATGDGLAELHCSGLSREPSLTVELLDDVPSPPLCRTQDWVLSPPFDESQEYK